MQLMAVLWCKNVWEPYTGTFLCDRMTTSWAKSQKDTKDHAFGEEQAHPLHLQQHQLGQWSPIAVGLTDSTLPDQLPPTHIINANGDGYINHLLMEAADELDSQELERPQKASHISNFRLMSPLPRDSPDLLSPSAAIILIQDASRRLCTSSPQDALLGFRDEQGWQEDVQSLLQHPEDFLAGFISTRLPVWQLYFQRFGMTKRAKEILHWLDDGLSICWVPFNDWHQIRHPRFNQRLQLVKRLLANTVGEDLVDEYLEGSEPKQVRFKNRVSVQMHREFVAAELQALLQVGTIQPWHDADGAITVINGL